MIYGNIYADGHANNSMFAEVDTVHRYNPTSTSRLLRQALLQRGIEINTPDLNVGRQVAFELHAEGRPLGERTRPRYLIAMENPNINPLNCNPDYCRQFDLVFAWDTRLQHLPNVVPTMIPHPLQAQPWPPASQRNIFSCLINANKAFKETLASDLYTERLHTIRWYERHAPQQFALFGMGWDKHPPAFSRTGRLRRSAAKTRDILLRRTAFPSFRGAVEDKSAVLCKAVFAYCYENSRNLSNYITEKIFDSLVCGCIPIYWGADNITEHIPSDCFIDRRKFKDTAQVHQYLTSLSDADLSDFRTNIQTFLQSQQAQPFKTTSFVDLVACRLGNSMLNLPIICGSIIA